jgi:hypothetical protein
MGRLKAFPWVIVVAWLLGVPHELRAGSHDAVEFAEWRGRVTALELAYGREAAATEMRELREAAARRLAAEPSAAHEAALASLSAAHDFIDPRYADALVIRQQAAANFVAPIEVLLELGAFATARRFIATVQGLDPGGSARFDSLLEAALREAKLNPPTEQARELAALVEALFFLQDPAGDGYSLPSKLTGGKKRDSITPPQKENALEERLFAKVRFAAKELRRLSSSAYDPYFESGWRSTAHWHSDLFKIPSALSGNKRPPASGAKAAAEGIVAAENAWVRRWFTGGSKSKSVTIVDGEIALGASADGAAHVVTRTLQKAPFVLRASFTAPAESTIRYLVGYKVPADHLAIEPYRDVDEHGVIVWRIREEEKSELAKIRLGPLDALSKLSNGLEIVVRNDSLRFARRCDDELHSASWTVSDVDLAGRVGFETPPGTAGNWKVFAIGLAPIPTSVRK